MKLTAAQIDELFLFTEKKYVRYYDLQVELVDHLATRIEEVMQHDKIPFEAALQKVYKDFGLFGFSKVVQEKEQQVKRAGRRLLWQEITKLFSWPEISLVACIGIITWQLTDWVSLDILFPIFFIAWITASIYLIAIALKKRKQQKKELLGLPLYPVIGPVWAFEYFFIFRAGYTSPVIFCMIVVMGIVIKLASQRVYRNTRRQAAFLYPEAFA